MFLVSTSNSKNYPFLPVPRAGVGRTGTVIAIWQMMDDYWADRMVNIVRTIEKMRECRKCMVQTEVSACAL